MATTKSTKDDLVRGLVTKICIEKKMPEVKYDKWFISDTDWKVIEYLKSRRNDLPSIEFLEKTFKFRKYETDLTVTDCIIILNREYVKEGVTKLFSEVRDEYKDKGDQVSEHEILKLIKSNVTLAVTAISDTNVTSLSDIEGLAASYEKYTQLKDPIPTGFERIDAEAPFRRGELVCLIGGTGGGKSLTVQKMFASNILNGTAASLFSLEMGDVQVMSRLLPILTAGKVKHSDLRFAKLSVDQFKKEVSKYQGNFNIITRKTAMPMRVSTIENHLEEQKAKGNNVEVVYLDYLGLLDQDKAWNAEESISGQLKRIALQYNCLIVILVQADTATLQSKAMPSITSIADNKGIARDCDIVFALKSERNNDKDNTLTIEYDFLKRRDDGAFISVAYNVNANEGRWKETFCGQG